MSTVLKDDVKHTAGNVFKADQQILTVKEIWRWTYLNKRFRKQTIDVTIARVMEVDIPEQKFEETTNRSDQCKSYGGRYI